MRRMMNLASRTGVDRRLLKLLPIERWPTKEEASEMRWFQPINLGQVTLHQRTWIPAMVPWRATASGEVTDEVVEWYRRFAQGQPGAIVVEATGIREVPSGPLLRIGHDRFLPGLSRLVEAVRQGSEGRTKLFIQLIDFLAIKRRPPREKYLQRFLAVDETLTRRARDQGLPTESESALREALLSLTDEQLRLLLSAQQWRDFTMGYREQVSDEHLPHVRELPQVLPGLFSRAALRAQAAGFDGVELHYAHAYTMASFLSAKNTRADGYGGSRDQRVRLPLEVYRAVRQQVGPDYCVGARFLGDEVIDGGSHLEDATFFGVEFAKAGMNFLSISKGGKFEDAKQPKVGEAAYPYTGPSGHECMPTVKIDGTPFGRNVPLASEIRAAIRNAGLPTPVVTAGGISSPWQAEKILEQGDADIVAAARQSLCDPDWFRKILLGQGSVVRRCFFTNYCEGLDQKHRAVTCQRWDRDFQSDDPTGQRSRDGKRRLVAPPWQA